MSPRPGGGALSDSEVDRRGVIAGATVRLVEAADPRRIQEPLHHGADRDTKHSRIPADIHRGVGFGARSNEDRCANGREELPGRRRFMVQLVHCGAWRRNTMEVVVGTGVEWPGS